MVEFVEPINFWLTRAVQGGTRRECEYMEEWRNYGATLRRRYTVSLTVRQRFLHVWTFGFVPRCSTSQPLKVDSVYILLRCKFIRFTRGRAPLDTQRYIMNALKVWQVGSRPREHGRRFIRTTAFTWTQLTPESSSVSFIVATTEGKVWGNWLGLLLVSHYRH